MKNTLLNRQLLSDSQGHGKILKNGVAVLVLSSAMTLSGLSQSVHAAEVTAPTAISATPTAIQPTQPTEVTPNQLDQAQQNLNNASQAVDAQNQVVDKATTDYNSASTTVENKTTAVDQAQVVANQATPQAIANQEAVIANTNNQISTVTSNIETTNTNIADKTTLINNQATIVGQAQKTTETAKAALDEAKQKEQQAQAILDGTGATDLYNQQDALVKKVATDTTAVNTATTDLANAKAADAKLANDINIKATEVSNKTTEVSNLSNQLPGLQTNVNNTGDILNKATTDLNVAQADVDGINTFVMTTEYANTLKAFNNAAPGSAERNSLRSQLDLLSEPLLAQNIYKSNANDKLVTISDINNIPTNILKELSLFGSELENQIRSYFGTVKTVVTPDSIDAADLVTDGYVSDNWGWDAINSKGHDAKALAIPGTNPDTNLGTSVGENMNTVGQQTYSTTLDDLKSMVFEAYKAFMYADTLSNYGHARSISGLTEDTRATTTYLGIDISSVDGDTTVHVNDFNNLDTAGVAEFDATVISNPDTPAKLNAILSNAKSVYATAKTNSDAAIAKLTSTTTQYNQAKSVLATMVKELDVLKTTKLQAPGAQAKLDKANKALVADQKSLDAVNASVATLEADVAVKKAALDAAKAEVAKKDLVFQDAVKKQGVEQAKLDVLNQELKALKSELAKEQVSLAEAKTQLAEEELVLYKLTHADEELAKAKAELAKAKELLDAAAKTLSIEKEKLADLIAKKALANTEYNDLLKAYNAQEAARLEAEKAAIEAQGKIAVPVYDKKGQLVSYETAKEVVKLTSKTSNWTKNMSAEVENTNDSSQSTEYSKLPATDVNTNILAMLIGMMMIGLVKLMNKKRQ